MEINELVKVIIDETVIKGTFSQPKLKSCLYHKVLIHRIEDDPVYYQLESFTKEQAFHQNIRYEELQEALVMQLENYKQLFIVTGKCERTVRISKKGKLHVTVKGKETKVVSRSHNVKKHYLLPEGEPIDFLIRLGIMDDKGGVRHKWYDKYRQINRYLEFIEDGLKEIDKEELTIIDFGCGKSYLTFAAYYYLVKVKGLKVKIIGLDLKEKVIHDLQALTKELKYEGLEFRVGDIAMFDYDQPIDMVISLHACNLATDYALEKAVKWKAKVIMAVPCCHKELNKQIDKNAMKSLLEYGIIKERMAALMTDGLRARLLEAKGYETQIVEFIDMEHTPKNIMIRGYLKHAPMEELPDDYQETCKKFSLTPTLEKLLFK